MKCAPWGIEVSDLSATIFFGIFDYTFPSRWCRHIILTEQVIMRLRLFYFIVLCMLTQVSTSHFMIWYYDCQTWLATRILRFNLKALYNDSLMRYFPDYFHLNSKVYRQLSCKTSIQSTLSNIFSVNEEKQFPVYVSNFSIRTCIRSRDRILIRRCHRVHHGQHTIPRFNLLGVSKNVGNSPCSCFL